MTLPNTINLKNVSFIQANLRYSKAASSAIVKRMQCMKFKLALLQEPWINKGIKGLNTKTCKIICDYKINNPRAAILARKNLLLTPLSNYISRDLVAVTGTIIVEKRNRTIVFASAYFPGDDINDPPPTEVRRLITFCKEMDYLLILSCDANSHNLAWLSSNNNKRGIALLDYILTNELCILNEGADPTFISNGREEVLDLTICSPLLIPLMKDWHVSPKPSFSDHMHIVFSLTKDISSDPSKRNPRKTNWNIFTDIIKKEAVQLPTVFTNPKQIEEGANRIEHLLLNAYNSSTYIKVLKEDKPKWWTQELEELKTAIGVLRNRSHKTNDKTLLNKLANHYKSLLRKAQNDSWNNFCSSLNSANKAEKIYKMLNKKKSNSLGFLKTPSGTYTKTKEETIRLMYETHFPDSIPHVKPSPFFRKYPTIRPNKRFKRTTDEIFQENKIRWAVNSFGPFKAPGGDQIIPIRIQKSLPHIEKSLTSLFKASFIHGQIPTAWCKVNVIFLPKPGKSPEEPKSYRPISLSSFFLKTIERLLDYHIRSHLKKKFPLHPLQFAYISGKSTDLALHHIVSKLENTIRKDRHIALGCVLMDIQGAFDNTGFNSFDSALRKRGIDSFTRNWINAMLRNRQITTNLDGTSATYTASKGCPQGGVISPLLWTIVIDDLIAMLNNMGYYTIGYADVVCIIIVGTRGTSISERMKRAIKLTMDWCGTHGLSINPSKTVLVPFRKRAGTHLPKIQIQSNELKFSESVTYLGVKIYRTLNWTPHLQMVIAKATKNVWALRSLIGKDWGTSPIIILDTYKLVIRPAITYGSLVWWKAVGTDNGIKLCNKIQ